LLRTDGDRCPESIAEQLCRDYDVGFDRALTDIEALYRDLQEKDLVASRGQAAGRVYRGTGIDDDGPG
jgi:hypothetical protein